MPFAPARVKVAAHPLGLVFPVRMEIDGLGHISSPKLQYELKAAEITRDGPAIKTVFVYIILVFGRRLIGYYTIFYLRKVKKVLRIVRTVALGCFAGLLVRDENCAFKCLAFIGPALGFPITDVASMTAQRHVAP